MACLCPIMSGAPVGKTQFLGELESPGGVLTHILALVLVAGRDRSCLLATTSAQGPSLRCVCVAWASSHGGDLQRLVHMYPRPRHAAATLQGRGHP